MGWDLGELGNKAELDQLELELGLYMSFEDFPGGWAARSGNIKKLSWGFRLLS